MARSLLNQFTAQVRQIGNTAVDNFTFLKAIKMRTETGDVVYYPPKQVLSARQGNSIS